MLHESVSLSQSNFYLSYSDLELLICHLYVIYCANYMSYTVLICHILC